jgi:predicted ferric reductase
MSSTFIYFVVSSIVFYLMFLVASRMPIRSAFVMCYLVIAVLIGATHYRILFYDTVFSLDTSSVLIKLTALTFLLCTCFAVIKRLMKRNVGMHEDIN